MMRGADLDAQDVRGYAALHYAVESTSLKMLRQLVECGANVNIRNGDGNTPLHLFVIQLIIENTANVNITNAFGETPLHHGCSKNNVFAVEELQKYYVDRNAKDARQQTPLIAAACNNSTEPVRKF
jgi:ankyrin repeat protein